MVKEGPIASLMVSGYPDGGEGAKAELSQNLVSAIFEAVADVYWMISSRLVQGQIFRWEVNVVVRSIDHLVDPATPMTRVLNMNRKKSSRQEKSSHVAVFSNGGRRCWGDGPASNIDGQPKLSWI